MLPYLEEVQRPAHLQEVRKGTEVNQRDLDHLEIEGLDPLDIEDWDNLLYAASHDLEDFIGYLQELEDLCLSLRAPQHA